MHRRSVVTATALAVLGVALLLGLGFWQLERKTWKVNLNAALAERLAQAPVALPAPAVWPRLTQEKDEFRRVAFPAEFIAGEEALVYSAGSALRSDVKGPGYWLFAPARVAGGSVVVINRGFVPLDRKDPASRAGGTPTGLVEVVGAMRWPENRGLFTPTDDAAANVWYLRDHKAMSDAKEWASAAPFYIDQEAPMPAGAVPRPGRLDVQLRDNHLGYAITWFGLALGLIGVYAAWLVGRLRRRA